MNTKETLNKVRTLLGIQVKFEQMQIENGAVLEAEAFEVGAEVFIVADDERVAVPVGEYTVTESGMVIIVSDEGIIGEIKDATAPEEEVVEEEENPQAELPADPSAAGRTPVPTLPDELANEKATPKKVVKSISEETFFAEIEKLRNEFKLSQEPKVELSAEVEEVSGISHNPESKSDKKELFLYSQKGKKSVLNTIYNQINK